MRVGDVFISYSPLDRARVRAIAERLTSLGYAVAWEHDASAVRVSEKLDGARAVLVVWTHSARRAPGVFGAAARALDEAKLLQMRLDDVTPPAPFDLLPLADMSGDRAEWGQLEHDLQRLAKGGAAPAPLTQIKEPGPFAVPAPAGAPKRAALLLLFALLAFTGVLAATYGGLMRLDDLQSAMGVLAALAGLAACLAFYRLFLLRRAGG